MRAFSRSCILTLTVGIIFGFFSAYVLLSVADWSPLDIIPCSHCGSDDVEASEGREISLRKQSEDSHLADELSRNVRVLCWVMTRPTGVRRCESIKKTWGKRCNVLLFMSSKEDTDLPAIGLDVIEGRTFLWAKTKKAFAYVFEHYLDSADWFMKADDDTYVMVDNLRYMLQAHNPNDPLYFGRKFVKYVEKGYMSGGSGYVLSKEAVTRFVKVALQDPSKCRAGDQGDEDLEMGKCLGNVGVVGASSSDCLGRGRFFPLELDAHLTPGRMKEDNWYWEYANLSAIERKQDCCSETAVSFHYVGPEAMEVFEFFIHHIRPYGINTHLVKGKDSHLYC